jgi:hypothetical protein
MLYTVTKVILNDLSEKTPDFKVVVEFVHAQPRCVDYLLILGKQFVAANLRLSDSSGTQTRG